MKQIYTLLSFFITLGAYSQIELEHTYPDSRINRALLEISGEKYFHEINSETNSQCLIYNADHSLWKTIDLPLPEDVINNAGVFHISETKINPDNEIEVAYFYDREVDGNLISESRIVNENGSVLFTYEGLAINLLPLEDYPDKLIAYKIISDIIFTEVYSLPEFEFEHEYSGSVRRINLENSGEKYYVVNQVEATMEVYNSDHTLWKTINLVTTPGATINEARISNTMNSDDLLEVIYKTTESIDNTFIYSVYVINENNEVLLTVEDGWGYNYTSEEGLEDELIVYQGGQTANWKVYSLPGLTLEHTQSAGGAVKRINLETLGEKYFNIDPQGESIQAYNADYSPWVSIDPVPGTTFESVYHISESKIDLNEEVEIIYRLINQSGGNMEIIIINQDAEILLDVDNVFGYYLSKISGLQNKFIVASLGTSNVDSEVYSLPSGSLGFTKTVLNEDISVFPNPSSGSITLDTEIKLPETITIHSIDGKLISEIKSPSSNTIDVSFLSGGLYLLVGKEGDQTVFSEKFVVEGK